MENNKSLLSKLKQDLLNYSYEDLNEFFTKVHIETEDADLITVGRIGEIEKVASDFYKEEANHKQKVVYKLKQYNCFVECVYNENKGIVEDTYVVEPVMFYTYLRPEKIIRNSGLIQFDSMQETLVTYLDSHSSDTEFISGLFMTVETIPDGDIKYCSFYIDYTYIIDYIDNNTPILNTEDINKNLLKFKNNKEEHTYTILQDSLCITVYKVNNDSLTAMKEVLYLSVFSNYNKLKDLNKLYAVSTQ